MPVKTQAELRSELDATIFANPGGEIVPATVHALLLDMIDSAGTGGGVNDSVGTGAATGSGSATAAGKTVFPAMGTAIGHGSAIAPTGPIPDFQIDFTTATSLPAWISSNHTPNLSSSGLLIGPTDLVQLTGGALSLFQGSAFSVVTETSGMGGGGLIMGNGNNFFLATYFDPSYVYTYNGTGALIAPFPSGTWANLQRAGFAGDGTGRSICASGSSVHTDNSAYIASTVTSITIGNDAGLDSPANGYIRWLALFAQRVLDTVLRAETIVPGSLGPIDVMLTAGQSNATGYQDDGGSLSYTTDSNVVTLDYNGDIVPYRPNSGFTGFESGNSGGRWAGEMEYSRQYRSANPSNKIAIFKYTYPGTDLGVQWNVNTVNGIYSDATTYFQSGIAALTSVGYTPTVRLVYWMQGENDALNAMYASSYEANLTDLVNAVRMDWSLGSSNKFVIGRIRTAVGPYSSDVRTAEHNVASANPGGPVWIIDTDDLAVNTDNLHYTSASQITIGQRIFACDQGTYTEP